MVLAFIRISNRFYFWIRDWGRIVWNWIRVLKIKHYYPKMDGFRLGLVPSTSNVPWFMSFAINPRIIDARYSQHLFRITMLYLFLYTYSVSLFPQSLTLIRVEGKKRKCIFIFYYNYFVSYMLFLIDSLK